VSTTTDAEAIITRATRLAHWVAIEANVKIRMMRAGSTAMVTMEPLQDELNHAQMQIRLLRQDLHYTPMADPNQVNPSHVGCEAEADALRTRNLKLKVSLDKLWAKAAHLEAQLREVKPSRYPLLKPKRGRPPGPGRRRVEELAAEMESMIGFPVPRAGKNSTTRYLTQPAMEAIVRMLHEAADCRTLHGAAS